jgi:PEP-CTERM motif
MTRSPRIALHVLAAAALLASFAAQAQPISLVNNTINMFRDTRGANDVGIANGDRFQFGANVVGGSLGTLLGATYAPSGFTTSQFACSPDTNSPTFCARTTPFDAGRLEPWLFRFTRGGDTLEVAGPSLAGAGEAVPFPVSVTLSGSGLTPTISWQVPNGFAPDAFRVNIFDKNRIKANGSADILHSIAIAASSTSYTVPTTFSSGLSLQTGGNYTINLQMIETRGHVPLANNNNALILRRSSSFFAFTPLSGNGPPDVALPTVDNGVYNFNVAQVGPGSVTFIDPFVAIGYDYATGAGDPNFASVLLPDVGDGQFTLEFTDASGAQSVSLADGTQYFFGGNGVSSFRVSGIETGAMLDPANATAFITGLTFAANGAFTGTMTPITQFVPNPIPEPQTYALMALGLLGIGLARHRTKA